MFRRIRKRLKLMFAPGPKTGETPGEQGTRDAMVSGDVPVNYVRSYDEGRPRK